MEYLSSRREREAPWGGGRAKIENSSRRHPRKFGLKRFLPVRRSWRGNGVACFGLPPWKKIIGGVTAIVSYRSDGWMQRFPCRGVLSFRWEARESLAVKARAQQPAMPVIGYLVSLGRNDRADLAEAFRPGE